MSGCNSFLDAITSVLDNTIHIIGFLVVFTSFLVGGVDKHLTQIFSISLISSFVIEIYDCTVSKKKVIGHG